MSIYPILLRDDTAILEKWDTYGRARRHQGTTFVCNVVVDSPIYKLGERIQNKILDQGLGHHYGLLPPSSFHMTVADGLKLPEYVGQQERWPDWLAGLSFLEAVEAMKQRLMDNALEPPESLNMVVNGTLPLFDSLTLKLEPADSLTQEALSKFRHTVYDILELKIKNIDSYQFHISLGYRLTDSDPRGERHSELEQTFAEWAKEVDKVDLEPVGFCLFADMLSFPQIIRYE